MNAWAYALGTLSRVLLSLPVLFIRDVPERATPAVVAVVLAGIAMTGLHLFGMYLVGHRYVNSIIWFGLAAAAAFALKYTWYKNLPEPNEEAAGA